jgi:PAS domain S-box-containing protein
MLLLGDDIRAGRTSAQLTRRMEETLRLHHQAIEASTAGITISDLREPDQPLVFANAAFLAMTGYRQDDVLGRNCRFLQRGDRDQLGLYTLRAALREGRDCAVLLRNYRRDGTPFWNELTMAPVRDEAGALTHYIGVQTDVTARKEAEDGLHRANGELERRVAERTADLAAANAALRTELAERRRAEEALRASQEQLLTAQFEMLDRLARAAEFRDDDTGQHTHRVGETVARIAAALGFPADEASLLVRAALLHDIGKIGIPDSILLKPGRLTPDEFAAMRTHTTRGAGILQGSRHRLLQLAEEIARSHHERWDGAGYPHGLAGEAIPLSGRIVAVADVFDALTNARPYKPAWSREAALAEIAAGAGSHFDPRVVEAFLRAEE